MYRGKEHLRRARETTMNPVQRPNCRHQGVATKCQSSKHFRVVRSVSAACTVGVKSRIPEKWMHVYPD